MLKSLASLTSLFLASVVLAIPAMAAGAPVDGSEGVAPPAQLIVRLSHRAEAPTPESLVEAVGREDAVPGGLGAGQPTAAKFVIPRRASGKIAEGYRLEPDSPGAQLQRYVVLTYPADANLEAIQEALERNPHVEWVGPVRYAELSVEPNDPRFDDNPGGIARPPEDHQWGSYALSLPQAWNYSKGHAYVGVLDTGIDADHEDLWPFDNFGNYTGGNFRPHLSCDYGTIVNNMCTSQVDDNRSSNNHGTHVSGIVGATANNSTGVAGACWECSVIMSQLGSFTQAEVANAIEETVDRGMQVLSMSFGFHPNPLVPGSSTPPDCVADPGDPLCVALQYATNRDVVMAAAAGNNGLNVADYPASDPRVLGVAGIDTDGTLWEEPCSVDENCGSNYEPDFFAAPAKSILSTFYLGKEYAPNINCSDNVDGVVDGYGPCTGTSMASPYLAASVGILRSINPWLTPDDVRSILLANLDNPPAWDPAHGHGKPDVFAAAKDALGTVGGQLLDNRLTPLFQLYGFVSEDHVYTTVPQAGTAFTRGAFYANADYRPTGPDVPGYTYFPNGNCLFVPCPAAASVYIFTGDRSPNGHPLVPLYRMSFEGTFSGGPNNPDNRDHTYTTEAPGLEVFKNVGYRLDGVEGYIYERCSPEPSCIPAGAVRLYRYYNSTRDDWAIFPESELATWQANGYGPTSGTNDWIGYVYENVDNDGDAVINGFETLIGTNPNLADSDGDGLSDGDEILTFPYSDPLVGGAQTIAELGQLSDLTHVSQTVILSRSFVNPVVIAKSPSYNGPHQSVVRITDVQSDRFTMHIDEAPNMDGAHTTETVSWMVLEAGSWVLADGTELEAGTIATDRTVGTRVSGGSFATINFPNAFPVAPIVLTQVQSDNDPSWVKTRAQRPTTTSVRVALEEEEAATAYHGAVESIGWVAMTPGTGSWSGNPYHAGDSGDVVTDAFHTVSLSGFSAAPKLLSTLASRDGGNNSAIRYRNLGSTSFQVKVEEDTSWDTEVAHIAESVHFLAIQGSGTLSASPR